jgi:hypothetical protein
MQRPAGDRVTCGPALGCLGLRVGRGGPKSDIGPTALVQLHSRLLPRPRIENRSQAADREGAGELVTKSPVARIERSTIWERLARISLSHISESPRGSGTANGAVRIGAR